ncbi:MAG: hypothetical protein HC777_03630, partial [Hyphomonadaceae bacterium]|nr:hypothetical protein [Hyphomonadaceae bacterium]
QRVGPDVHGNRLLENSINGLFVRTQTPAGNDLERLTAEWEAAAKRHSEVVASES